jgi:hypothetical protein
MWKNTDGKEKWEKIGKIQHPIKENVLKSKGVGK